MSIARHHAEWLSLVPVSGPFLSLPVLLEAFNTGLEPHDPDHVRLLRQEHANWQDSLERRKADPASHRHWIHFVLTKTLDLDERVLAEGQAIPQTLHVEVPEHHEFLRPNIVIFNPGPRSTTPGPRLLIQIYPRSQELTSYVAGSPWKASPDTRMTELLHGTGVQLGLITNGEHWMLVHAPKGETTGYASWYATLWLEEPITLRAFRSLLSASRFFNVPDDQTLEALLTKSAANQQEVTDQLGYQVRQAVEVLIHSLDRADQDFGRELLADVTPEQLYESALTVMMRLVFLFCAEERELIPSKPFPVYEQNYSVSTISKQLRELADQHGEELLERRYDAWPRLLAAFRAVYGGLKHDDLHIPAYGGSLFHPDRFPFLEGRKKGTAWTEDRGPGTGGFLSRSPDSGSRIPFQEANPLPVNNRTVLHLLEALQLLQIKVPGGGPAEARRLSFRALDIEQIGHVYEGLLDHTAKRATEPYVGLIGSRDKEPEIALAALETKSGEWSVASEEKRMEMEPPKEFIQWLKEETGRSEKALIKALQNSPLATNHSPLLLSQLRTACGGDEALLKRVIPFAGLIRLDTFGYPVVIPKGSVFVTAGTDRRSSGTHYTPRSLTEPIVQYTLEPLVYIGPAEGKPKGEWKLKSARELLELKICDMACGSGAFLVQAARYMSERLLEAWELAERGAGTWNRGPGEPGDGDSIVSGVGSVEIGDGLGGGMLPSDQSISQGRTLWDDEPDSAGGSLDSSEHRRRTRAGTHKGIPESPEYRTRISDGSSNASVALPSSRTPQRSGDEQTDADLRTNQSDDLPSSAISRTAALNPGAQTSVPDPRSSVPGPRITPFGLPSTGGSTEEIIPNDPIERRTYAMRIIAQRCLYGVDKNPLAAEMAKLSLWLLTLAKDKPFEFLDHSIRCGDSLVGLHSIDQLRHYSLKPDADDAVLFKGPLDSAVDEAINLRLKLEDMPANTVDDVQRQEKLLTEANEKIARLRCAADLLVAAEFWGESAKDKLERVRHAAVVSGHYIERGPTEEFQQVANKEWRAPKTNSSLATHHSQLQPFHWPLEFPEVIVKRGGFDAFVGNPPFMGGYRIGLAFGSHYRAYIGDAVALGAKGSADIVAFFVLRACGLVRQPGVTGLIATNTIAQGDTRQVGLEQLVDSGLFIIRSVPAYQWPGVASVEVSLLWMRNGVWHGVALLNDKPVSRITPYLTEQGSVSGNPHRLWANIGKAFKGTTTGCAGFVITPDEALRLIAKDPRNKDVLFPFLGGQEFNSTPDMKPTRWVINFHEWGIEQSKRYPDCFQIVEDRVRPYAESRTGQVHEPDFWKFSDKRLESYRSIQHLRRVLFHSFTSKYVAFGFVDTGIVYSAPHVVIGYDDWFHFACLQSSLHVMWAFAYCSTMETRLRYAPSDLFDTYPFPLEGCEAGLIAVASTVGERYYMHRSTVMTAQSEGLTDTYNRFHDPDETSADIQKLRDLHVEMDQAVAAAYGWTDLDLGHGFHETKQGVRFTISESARREVLQRLLKLNHERYAEEVKQGLHGKKRGPGTGNRGPGKKTANKPAKDQPSLFDGEEGE